MAEDSVIHRSWKSVSHPDADVDLLQRSITHVEHLLSRLEYEPASVPQVNNHPTDDAAVAATEISKIGQGSGSGSVAASLPFALQADLLRITLSAHDDANRIRAQAADAHAEAVAESERLLAEAERLCEQLRADAVSEAQAHAAELRTAAHEEAEAIRRDVRSWADAALAEAAAAADAVRSLAHDTLSGVVERLTDALDCLHELTTALGPHAPLAAALAETQRRAESDIGSTAGAGVISEGPGDSAAGDISSGVVQHDGEMPISHRAGNVFRTSRR